jgi:hypothetical protein
MPSLMNILLSVSTDRSSSFSLLKSFHQKCVRATILVSDMARYYFEVHLRLLVQFIQG